MTKAERRKRSRQRAKERERSATPPVADGALPVAVPVSSAPAVVLAPSESPFITGPVAPKASPPAVQRAARIELPPSTLIRGEVAEESEGENDDEDEEIDDEGDEGDEDGDELDDPEDDAAEDADDDEDDDEDDDDDDEDATMDAVFNAACAAVEQGDQLSWNEVVACLCEAEVTDPRLGLVVALLLHDGPHPLPLTGERLLAVLTDMGLPDIVAEAREVATLAPGEAGETPEERAIVRTNARELREQATNQLASGARSTQPLKASDLKKRSALGGVVPLPAAPTGRASR